MRYIALLLVTGCAVSVPLPQEPIDWTVWWETVRTLIDLAAKYHRGIL